MKRFAAFAIRVYRRYLSGRGPLRRVSCTFARTESCSAYGLRMVEEAPFGEALRRIRARIRACRCTSVYRFSAGLGWERDHERAPAELAAELGARGERAETIAQVMAARMAVARWRGERARHVIAPIAIACINAAAPIPIRAGDAAIDRYRRATRRAYVLAAIALVTIAVHAIAVVPLVLAINAAANARAAARRLGQQRIAATFLRPSHR